VPDLSKIIKAERVKAVVLVHVWLSGIKALLGTNSCFWPGSSTLIEKSDYFYWLQTCPMVLKGGVFSFGLK
jgi:hypothetical protein